MKVLVTGHNGYIGTILVPLLLAEGHQVVGLDINLYQRSVLGSHTPYKSNIFKDIRDVKRSDLEGFDAIIHLAGLSNDPLGYLNPKITYQINYEASLYLARLAKQAGVQRFLFASSCSIYGSTEETIINEEAESSPLTPYARSKLLVEQEVSRLADTSFSPTYLRSGTAYGVSPLLRFDLVINNLAAWAYTTGKIYLKSDGSPWRPVVHIEDIARAFIEVLQASRSLIHNQAFNVGVTEENYRISQLAEIIKNVAPDCEVVYSPDAGPDKRSYRVDCSKIIKALNFSPKWNARKGIKEIFEFLSRVGLKFEDFEGARYNRASHIRYLLGTGHLDSELRWRTSA
ncbi:NAD-dependent epimerase/dehydratase family protein [Thermodesulfobacteriota bacterium]